MNEPSPDPDGVEPDDPAAGIPTPPDPADPLTRDTTSDGDGHPGVDPVTSPVPND